MRFYMYHTRSMPETLKMMPMIVILSEETTSENDSSKVTLLRVSEARMKVF